MDEESTLVFIGVVIVFAAGIFIGVLIGADVGKTQHQALAIEHGCAGYDRTTGEFIWNMEKDQ